MPRVHHVKKARKDNPVVKAGEEYYWWKHAFGPKKFSATKPKPWQTTQSGFLQTYYQLQEEIGGIASEDDADDFKGSLQELRDECEDSLYNMPDHLQETSDSGITLQERIDALDGWIGEIDNIDWEETDPSDISELIENSDPGL